MELGEMIRTYRTENKISQREFARRSSLSHALISILEMGTNKQTGKKPTPDIETYKKIAYAMGISVQELFEKLGDSEMVFIGDRKQNHPIVVPDSDTFRKIIFALSPSDYETVMSIFDKTEKKLRELGEL